MKLDSSLGKLLSALCDDEDVTHIVEIGAWLGEGSTRIISNAIHQRMSRPGRTARAWCLEANGTRALRAQRRHQKSEGVQILWGIIVDVTDVDRQDLNFVEEQWLQDDLQCYATAPSVLSALPDKIELLLLDGGEFSTYAEFRVLLPRLTKWLLLDDTHSRKCRQVVADLRHTYQHEWLPVWSSSERNGTALFLRKGGALDSLPV